MSLIIVGDRIKNTKRNSVGIDEFYGPYEADTSTNRTALQVAEDVLTSAHKLVPGQTVGIKQLDGSIKEYWVQPDGNSGYALEEKNAGGSSVPSMTAVPHSGATPGAVTVNGGEYHTFSDAIDSLTIVRGSSSLYAESHLEFDTSANFTAVTWPTGCKFANQEPMLAASSSYLVTILHGIVAVTEVVAS